MAFEPSRESSVRQGGHCGYGVNEWSRALGVRASMLSRCVGGAKTRKVSRFEAAASNTGMCGALLNALD